MEGWVTAKTQRRKGKDNLGVFAVNLRNPEYKDVLENLEAKLDRYFSTHWLLRPGGRLRAFYRARAGAHAAFQS